ncbi:MAG: hypothetical protein KBF88_09240 [Polyangiaceae bacterium]|nr:hypothetical protein [Polyangiaceae bacterium]
MKSLIQSVLSLGVVLGAALASQACSSDPISLGEDEIVKRDDAGGDAAKSDAATDCENAGGACVGITPDNNNVCDFRTGYTCGGGIGSACCFPKLVPPDSGPAASECNTAGGVCVWMTSENENLCSYKAGPGFNCPQNPGGGAPGYGCCFPKLVPPTTCASEGGSCVAIVPTLSCKTMESGKCGGGVGVTCCKQ